MNNKLICLGIISSSHGIKGAVKIKTFTEKPENIATYGELTDGTRNYKIKSTSVVNKDLIIAQIQGIDSRNDADLLKNKKLYVTRESLPLLENKDEFYLEDLINAKVKLINNVNYGYVKAIYNFGADDVFEISTEEQNNIIMLPFLKEIFVHVDAKQKIITLVLPEFID